MTLALRKSSTAGPFSPARRGYRADLVRVTSLGYVTIEVYRAGGLLASSTGQDVKAAMRPLFADLPS